MTVYLFPDTTVLRNFAVVRSLDLLERILDGRGRWTDAVAYEVHRSLSDEPALSAVLDGGWLGEPIEVDDPGEQAEVESIRRAVFGGRRENPTRHLGEAMTCYIIQTWSQLAGSWWISDDREAVRYGRKQQLTTLDTTDLLTSAVRSGLVDADAAYALLGQMVDRNRAVRLPSSVSELLL